MFVLTSISVFGYFLRGTFDFPCLLRALRLKLIYGHLELKQFVLLLSTFVLSPRMVNLSAQFAYNDIWPLDVTAVAVHQ